jgi:hypothetical protein
VTEAEMKSKMTQWMAETIYFLSDTDMEDVELRGHVNNVIRRVCGNRSSVMADGGEVARATVRYCVDTFGVEV